MIPLTEKEAGEALGLPPLATPVTGVSTDSRAIRAGDLFIALSGERFDGHDFVEAAFRAGATGAVVREDRVAGVAAILGACGLPWASERLYGVPDTLHALWALATAVRRKSMALVFAVTGSVGKTTTKNLLGAMVGQCRRVVVTPANQNNEIGVPLTLLSLDPDTEAVVLEMGMRGRGQIAQLAKVAEPDIGVITNIHPVHLELLGSLESIAEAKAELLCGLRAGGVGVVPAACEVLAGPAARAGCRLTSFAVSEGRPGRFSPVADEAETHGGPEALAEVEVEVLEESPAVGVHGASRGDDRLRIAVRWPGDKAVVEVHGLPGYLAENLAAAVAACYVAGLPVAKCLEGVRQVRPGRGRGEVICAGGLTVIDDTYNANPAAVKRALEHLTDVSQRRGGRPVAVLGDMLELGPEELRFHEEVGRYAAECGIAELWGIGPRSRATVEAFRQETGGEGAGHLDSLLEISRVISALRAGDVVLVKASRSVGLEKVVAALVEEAEKGRWGAGSPEQSRREGKGRG